MSLFPLSFFARLAQASVARVQALFKTEPPSAGLEVSFTPLSDKSDGPSLWSISASGPQGPLAIPVEFKFTNSKRAYAFGFGCFKNERQHSIGDIQLWGKESGVWSGASEADRSLLAQCARAIQRQPKPERPFSIRLSSEPARGKDPMISLALIEAAFFNAVAQVEPSNAPIKWRSHQQEPMERLFFSAAPLSVDFDTSLAGASAITADNRAWVCWERSAPNSMSDERAKGAPFLAIQRLRYARASHLSSSGYQHTLNNDLFINTSLIFEDDDEYDSESDSGPLSARDPGLFERHLRLALSETLLRLSFFKQLPDAPSASDASLLNAPALDFEIDCFAVDAKAFKALIYSEPDPLIIADEKFASLAQARVLNDSLTRPSENAPPKPKTARL